MAKDFTSPSKQSRREGIALHPKAIKTLGRRNYAPGDHGQARHNRPSDYGLQLREKQKVKRLYGLLERQFRRFVATAQNQSGIAGENLLKMLELRLDNAVYRSGLAPSRQSARQLVSHGHIRLNDKKATIPSMLVKPGDVISIKDASAKNSYFTALKESLAENKPEQFSWLSVDAKKLSAKITGEPQRSEISEPIEEQLIIEYYSR